MGIQFQWTADSQTALAAAKNDKAVMAKAVKKCDTLLRELVDITTRDLSKNDRTNVETIVTVHVHQRDTFEDLVRKKVKEPSDFEWLKQCRFYWREDIDGEDSAANLLFLFGGRISTARNCSLSFLTNSIFKLVFRKKVPTERFLV